jgi:hypothetical protein
MAHILRIADHPASQEVQVAVVELQEVVGLQEGEGEEAEPQEQVEVVGLQKGRWEPGEVHQLGLGPAGALRIWKGGMWGLAVTQAACCLLQLERVCHLHYLLKVDQNV